MKNVDSRSDLERQYDTGMLPECDLPKLIKTLKQERDSMLFNWKQAEKENKRLADVKVNNKLKNWWPITE